MSIVSSRCKIWVMAPIEDHDSKYGFGSGHGGLSVLSTVEARGLNTLNMAFLKNLALTWSSNAAR